MTLLGVWINESWLCNISALNQSPLKKKKKSKQWRTALNLGKSCWSVGTLPYVLILCISRQCQRMGDALFVILSQLYHSNGKTSKHLLLPDFKKGQESWKKEPFQLSAMRYWRKLAEYQEIGKLFLPPGSLCCLALLLPKRDTTCEFVSVTDDSCWRSLKVLLCLP